MSERKRDVALAIKRCLDSLVFDAKQGEMPELAHFLGIASLAAEDAARMADAHARLAADLMGREPMGHC